MDLFTKNLELLQERAPDLAFALRGVEAAPLPPPALLQVDLPPHEALYISLGLGRGEAFEQLRFWLEGGRERHLLFLEPNLPSWVVYLSLPEAEAALSHPRCHFATYDRTLGEEDPLFQRFAAFFSGLHYLPLFLPEFLAREGERGEAMALALQRIGATAQRICDEYRGHCRDFFQNFYRNLSSLPHAFDGNKLFGAFEGVPAIICGAGSSLTAQLPLLSRLKDRALLLAGGSSLNALSAGALLPHFGVGSDPHYPQYIRLMTNAAFELPFFYRSRWYHEALEVIQGPALYLNGASGEPIVEWVEEELGISGPILDSGYNVVNLSVEIARALGCAPIILVGVDLCYSQGRGYAEGVIPDGSAEEMLAELFHPVDRPCLVKDSRGESVASHYKWLEEARWLTRYAKEHPDIQFINCTTDGLTIPGFDPLTLEEVADQCEEEWPLEERVHAAIAQASFPDELDAPAIEKVMKELRGSVGEAAALLADLIKELQLLLYSSSPPPPSCRSGAAALYEYELQETLAYQKILAVQETLLKSYQARHFLALEWEKKLSHEERLRGQLELDVERFEELAASLDAQQKWLQEVAYERRKNILQ